MDVDSVDFEPHISQVTMSSSTEACTITVLLALLPFRLSRHLQIASPGLLPRVTQRWNWKLF